MSADRDALIEQVREAGRRLRDESPGAPPEPLVPARALLGEGYPTPPTGLELKTLPKLQGATGGIFGVWALAGETGLGKSALAWQLALDVGQRAPVLVYDFENGARVLLWRLSEITQGDLEKGRRFTERIFIRESIKSLEGDLAQIPAPALIVVDSIQALPAKIEHRKEGLDKWLYRFEAIAKSGYSVLMVSEVPRSAYGGEARVSSFKESGTIEFKSHVGIQLTPGENGEVDVNIVKNRHRPTKGLISTLRRVRGWRFVEKEESRG